MKLTNITVVGLAAIVMGCASAPLEIDRSRAEVPIVEDTSTPTEPDKAPVLTASQAISRIKKLPRGAVIVTKEGYWSRRSNSWILCDLNCSENPGEYPIASLSGLDPIVVDVQNGGVIYPKGLPEDHPCYR